uniref:Uncharacterized protein n=1 Tax=Eutreptiella gymnastica TaxID=73025 RepID=A0A7S4GAB6_9EUGL
MSVNQCPYNITMASGTMGKGSASTSAPLADQGRPKLSAVGLGASTGHLPQISPCRGLLQPAPIRKSCCGAVLLCLHGLEMHSNVCIAEASPQQKLKTWAALRHNTNAEASQPRSPSQGW